MIINVLVNLLHSVDSDSCSFGSPLSDSFNWTNSFLNRTGDNETRSWRDIVSRYYDNRPESDEAQEILNILNRTLYRNQPTFNASRYNYELDADDTHFAVRTCNAYWNPQVTITETNVDPFYLGMASQATEREDTIITPDLRGSVSCNNFSPFINVASLP